MTKRRIRSRGPGSSQSQVTPQPQVRDSILVAARGLFQRYGFRKTTMDDIARAMGKERTSLYYYFPGKKELVRALIESEFADISKSVHEEVAQEADAASRLRVYMHARLDQAVQRAAIYGQILPEMRSGGDGLPDIFQLNAHRGAFDEGEERYLVDTIFQGNRDGQFKAMAEAKVRLFVRFTFSAMRGLELDLLMNPNQAADLKSRLDVACDVFIRGLQR
jgi:AcrR family transcriptional regulator